MPRSPQVSVDITAVDRASKVLDAVADNAEALEKLDPQLIIGASDRASDDLEKVMDRAEKLDAETATVILEAEASKAEGEIRTLQQHLGRVDGETATATIQAKDAASARLEKIQSQLRDLDGRTATVEVEARGAERLSSLVSSLPGTLGKAGQAASGMSGGLLAAGAGASAVAAGAYALAQNASQAALQIGTLAQLTGESVATTDQLAAVWQSTGADVKDLADVMLQVNGVLAAQPELARQLGVALEDSSPQQIFIDTVEAIDGMTDATKKATLGSQVFGEEGVRQVAALTGMYGDLSDTVDGMEPAFDEESVRTAQEQAKATAELQRAFVELGVALEPLIGLSTAVAEGLTSMFESFGRVFGGDFSGKLDDKIVALKKEMQDAAYETDALARSQTVGLAGSSKTAATQVDILREANKRLADSLLLAEERTRGLMDAQQASADASFALLDAQEGMSDALAHTAELQASGTASAEDLSDAYTAERQAAINAGNAAKRVADEQAKANGKTATASELLAAQNKELFAQAQKASPAARNEIALYIAQINGIPPEKITEIMADTDPNNLAQVQKEIDNTANPGGKPRVARVTVEYTEKNRPALGGASVIVGPVAMREGAIAAPAPATYVTVNMPRGADGRSVLRVLNQHSRRNGRSRR